MLEIWTKEQEAENLSRLFDGVSNKAAFAREFKVPGGASMLSQHCSGHRPMSLEAAIAYAKGFKCSIAQISPRLALEVQQASGTEFSGLEPQVPSTAPTPNPDPTLIDTLARLAQLLQHADASTRETAAALLASLARNPDNHTKVATALGALLGNGSGLQFETNHHAGIPPATSKMPS